MAELPDWLTVGADVAELSGRDGVSSTKVERFTKTLVVLANGNRYRLDSLSDLFGGGPRFTKHDGGTWGWSTDLVAPDNPHALKLFRQKRIKKAASMVTEHMARLTRDPDDLAPVADVVRLLQLLQEKYSDG